MYCKHDVDTFISWEQYVTYYPIRIEPAPLPEVNSGHQWRCSGAAFYCKPACLGRGPRDVLMQ